MDALTDVEVEVEVDVEGGEEDDVEAAISDKYLGASLIRRQPSQPTRWVDSKSLARVRLQERGRSRDPKTDVTVKNPS